MRLLSNCLVAFTPMNRTWLKPQRIKAAQRRMIHQWVVQRAGGAICPSTDSLLSLKPCILRREAKVLRAEVRARESHSRISYL